MHECACVSTRLCACACPCVHTCACVCRGGLWGGRSGQAPWGVLGSEMTRPCPGLALCPLWTSGHASVTQKCPGRPQPASWARGGPAEAPGVAGPPRGLQRDVNRQRRSVTTWRPPRCPWQQQQGGTPALGSLSMGAAAGEACQPPARGQRQAGEEPQVSTQPPCVPAWGTGRAEAHGGQRGSGQPPGARRTVTQAGAGLRGLHPNPHPAAASGPEPFHTRSGEPSEAGGSRARWGLLGPRARPSCHWPQTPAGLSPPAGQNLLP